MLALIFQLIIENSSLNCVPLRRLIGIQALILPLGAIVSLRKGRTGLEQLIVNIHHIV